MPGYQSFDIRLVQVRNRTAPCEIFRVYTKNQVDWNPIWALCYTCSFLFSLLKKINNFFELQQSSVVRDLWGLSRSSPRSESLHRTSTSVILLSSKKYFSLYTVEGT